MTSASGSSAAVAVKAVSGSSAAVSVKGQIPADDLHAAISAAASLGISAQLQLSGSVSKVVSVLGKLKGRLVHDSVMVSLRGTIK